MRTGNAPWRTTAIHTRPTGLPSSSGSGPATPVIATATFAGERDKAPCAIAAATSTQTALFSQQLRGHAKRPGLILLGIGNKTAVQQGTGAWGLGQQSREFARRAGFRGDYRPVRGFSG